MSAVTAQRLAAQMTPTRTTKTVSAILQRNAATFGAKMTPKHRTSLKTGIAHATRKRTAANPKKNAATVRLNAAQTKVTHGQQIQTANRRIVIAERHAASTNEFLTLTPPTPTTASAFPEKMHAVLEPRIMRHGGKTPIVLSAILAKNAAPAILSPTTISAIATIQPNAAVLKVTDGRRTKSALAIQDTNAVQRTLLRLTPNTASVIQPRSAALTTPIRIIANHAYKANSLEKILNVHATRKENAVRILTTSFGLKTRIANAKTMTKHVAMEISGQKTLNVSATLVRDAVLKTRGLRTRNAFAIAQNFAASI